MKYLLSRCTMQYITSKSSRQAIEPSQYLLKNKNIKCVHNFLPFSHVRQHCHHSAPFGNFPIQQCFFSLPSVIHSIITSVLVVTVDAWTNRAMKIFFFPRGTKKNSFYGTFLHFPSFFLVKNHKAIKMIFPSWWKTSTSCCNHFHFYGFHSRILSWWCRMYHNLVACSISMSSWILEDARQSFALRDISEVCLHFNAASFPSFCFSSLSKPFVNSTLVCNCIYTVSDAVAVEVEHRKVPLFA